MRRWIQMITTGGTPSLPPGADYVVLQLPEATDIRISLSEKELTRM